ncbi:Ribosome biogenesis protein nsa2 [Metarhizium album ARSEF 1941]|uniref:Ribosome biogenesis protein NSA2 n=1 Tax=Metarhizium album (strain ARSEF 1941) TaxID=1081103 RepID=A0A0B2WDA2_METAS|nr:Ribosome biogenesis protein nsa2 [Metarhizium album ARSEF 1941]KHN93796.1 Ribosome biogenesis protein nsa2 [Metarhizium album ARSEF 1941]
MERFIRPSGLRQKTAHVSHPELAVTIKAPILSVKKNPSNPLYTRLGVLTKGCVIEVNTSELGLTTASGKVVWGRYAQITNDPENDGCVNAVLLASSDLLENQALHDFSRDFNAMNQPHEANGSPLIENILESNPDHGAGACDRPPQEGDVIAFASLDYDEEDMTEENRNACTITEDSAEGDVFKSAEAIASAMSSSVEETSDQQPVPQDVRCFTASQLQLYIERLDDVRSPQKAEDRKKFLETTYQIACITNNKPPSVPSSLYDSVIRSDAWYSAIFHRLFDFFVKAEQPQHK